MGVRWRGGGKSMMRQDGWDGMRVGEITVWTGWDKMVRDQIVDGMG